MRRSAALLAALAAIPLMAAGKASEPSARDGVAYGAFLAGQWAAQAADPDRATMYYERALAADPTAPALGERLFAESLTLGDMRKAVKMAHQLSGTEAVGRLARFVLAVDLLAQGKYADARGAFRDVGIEGGAGASSPVLEAWAAAGAGDLNGALAVLNDMGNTVPPLSLATRAQIFEHFDRLPEAEAAYMALAKTGKMPSPLIASYGRLLHRMGRTEDARLIYQALLSNSPGDPLITAELNALHRPYKARKRDVRVGAAATMALAAGLRGQLDPEPGVSVILLRLALHMDPKMDEAKLMLARSLMRTGAIHPARAVYASIPEGSVYVAEAKSGLAYAMRSSQDNAGATALLQKALDKAADPAQQRSYRETLSEFYQIDQRYGDAAAMLDTLLAERPDDVSLRLRRGMMRERMGNWPEALGDLDWVIARLPDNPIALNYLGYSLIDRNEQTERAFALLQRAVQLRPDDGSIIDSYGWALLLRGDVAGALAKLERAAELEPADPTVNHHLGDVYARLGRHDEARWQWTRALSLNPEAREKAALEQKLAQPATVKP